MKAIDVRDASPLVYASLLELVMDSGCGINHDYVFPDDVQFGRLESTLRMIKALRPEDLGSKIDTLDLYDCQDMLAHFICGDSDVQEAVRDRMGDDGVYAFQFLNDCFDGEYHRVMLLPGCQCDSCQERSDGQYHNAH